MCRRGDVLRSRRHPARQMPWRRVREAARAVIRRRVAPDRIMSLPREPGARAVFVVGSYAGPVLWRFAVERGLHSRRPPGKGVHTTCQLSPLPLFSLCHENPQRRARAVLGTSTIPSTPEGRPPVPASTRHSGEMHAILEGWGRGASTSWGKAPGTRLRRRSKGSTGCDGRSLVLSK